MDPISAAGVTARSWRDARPGDLAPGQVARARVVHVDGDRVQLAVGGQRLPAVTRVPLEAGQYVMLMVERARDGSILLRMVDDARASPASRRSTAGVESGHRPATQAPGQLGGSNAQAEPRQPAAPATRGAGLPGGEALQTPARLWLPGEAATAYRALAGRSGLTASSSLPGETEQAHPQALRASRDPRSDNAGHDLATGLEGDGFRRRLATARPRVPQAEAGPAGAGPGRTLEWMAGELDPVDNEQLASLLDDLAQLGVRPGRVDLAALERLLAEGPAPPDARAVATLLRLGLPLTRPALQVARALASGTHRPGRSWVDALDRLARLSAGASDPELAALARQALDRWTPPVDQDVRTLAQWLRDTIRDLAAPIEVKLARLPEHRLAEVVRRDPRATLEALVRALEHAPADPARVEARLSFERLRASIQNEQLLNAGQLNLAEPRYFAVTLPSPAPSRGAIELAVRQREARPGSAARLDGHVVTLRLALEELGELRISVVASHSLLACRFAAATPFAAALLRAGSGELAERLGRLGFEAATVEADQVAASTHEPTGSIERSAQIGQKGRP